MDYKIVKTSSQYPDVLFRRDREYDQDMVIVECFGEVENVSNYMAIEHIEFEDYKSAKLFIQYGVDDLFANRWCQNKGIKYE